MEGRRRRVGPLQQREAGRPRPKDWGQLKRRGKNMYTNLDLGVRYSIRSSAKRMFVNQSTLANRFFHDSAASSTPALQTSGLKMSPCLTPRNIWNFSNMINRAMLSNIHYISRAVHMLVAPFAWQVQRTAHCVRCGHRPFLNPKLQTINHTTTQSLCHAPCKKQ